MSNFDPQKKAQDTAHANTINEIKPGRRAAQRNHGPSRGSEFVVLTWNRRVSVHNSQIPSTGCGQKGVTGLARVVRTHIPLCHDTRGRRRDRTEKQDVEARHRCNSSAEKERYSNGPAQQLQVPRTHHDHRAPERAPLLPPRSISGHGDPRATCPAPPELFRDLARAGQKRRNTVDSRTVPAARTVGIGLRTTQAATAAGQCSLVLSPAPPNHVPTPRPTQKTPPACFHDALRCPERKREKCKGSGGPCPRHHRAGHLRSYYAPRNRSSSAKTQPPNYRWDGTGFSLGNVSLPEATL